MLDRERGQPGANIETFGDAKRDLAERAYAERTRNLGTRWGHATESDPP